MAGAVKHSTLQTAAAQVRRQTAVVEYHDDGGPEWWVMLPDGSVEVLDTASAALKQIQRAARKGNTGVTVTRIEWRNVPQGFEPPKGEM